MKTAKRLPRLARIVKSYLRAGFTLIEMLVATAVVVVMMAIFTQIFMMATSTMSVQKGLAENDQRARLVHSLLSGDLNGNSAKAQTRTFLCVIPFGAGEIPAKAPIDPVTNGQVTDASRLGYLSISENDPNDDTDDVLQLTVVSTSGTDLLFGRAQILADAAGNQNWSNQPEYDDVIGIQNQAGASKYAEVSYFLRNGSIYRRVMLVRNPPKYGSFNPIDEPTDDALADLSFTNYTNGTRNFWTDFDYAAYYDNVKGQPQFLGFDNLGVQTAVTLRNPIYRWGFSYTSPAGAGMGLPREFDSSSPPVFFGRFTQAETSDPNFAYPGRSPAVAANPIAQATPLTVMNGRVTSYPNGTRVGEDILMSNVITFDIKVWDPGASSGPDGKPGIAGLDDDLINGVDDNGELGTYGSDDGDWRDVGHLGLTGFYSTGANRNSGANRNIYFGANRFDTWGANVDIDGVNGPDAPPYLPIFSGKDQRPGVAGIDDPGSAPGVDDPTELGTPGSDDFAALTAIKITIRFYDVTSNQVRDLSAVFSMVPQ